MRLLLRTPRGRLRLVDLERFRFWIFGVQGEHGIARSDDECSANQKRFGCYGFHSYFDND